MLKSPDPTAPQSRIQSATYGLSAPGRGDVAEVVDAIGVASRSSGGARRPLPSRSSSFPQTKTSCSPCTRAGSTITRQFIVFSAFTTRAPREGALDLLSEAAVDVRRWLAGTRGASCTARSLERRRPRLVTQRVPTGGAESGEAGLARRIESGLKSATSRGCALESVEPRHPGADSSRSAGRHRASTHRRSSRPSAGTGARCSRCERASGRRRGSSGCGSPSSRLAEPASSHSGGAARSLERDDDGERPRAAARAHADAASTRR